MLTGYRELDPGAMQDLRAELDAPPTVVVISRGWFIHGFPTSTANSDAQRRTFELEQICSISPGAMPQIDLECSLPTAGEAHWRTLTCVRSSAVKELHEDIGSPCRIMSDVRADVYAALSSVPPQSEHWLMFGRRGDQFITAVIGTDHRPELLSAQPVVQGLPLQDAIFAELALIRQRHGVHINHVLLFGDHLTIGMFETIRPLLRQANIKAARLQPFRNVGSELDAEAERRIIARAHVVAPVMAALFTDV